MGLGDSMMLKSVFEVIVVVILLLSVLTMIFLVGDSKTIKSNFLTNDLHKQDLFRKDFEKIQYQHHELTGVNINNNKAFVSFTTKEPSENAYKEFEKIEYDNNKNIVILG
jgi:hypothetical protein